MRRRAIFIFVVLLVMLTATRPSAAVGPCNTDNHDLTVINLKTDTGYIIRLNLWRDSEGKIHGLAFWNARDAEHGGGRGTVNGEFLPNGGISIRINLQYPAPPGAQILISGRLFEGYGKGTLWETDWDSDAPTTHWTAQTLDGCPKWPEDVLRSDLAKAAEAYADQAAPALAAADPLYACDADAWSLSGSFGHEFMSGCLKEAAKVFPWDTSGYPEGPRTRLTSTRPGSMPWKACEAALNKRVNALIEAMRPTCDKAKRLTAAKNRCVPAHTTADGKIYQNVPRPFTDEGKDCSCA